MRIFGDKTRLLCDTVGVVPKVFRQETSPCKFDAFAPFDETRSTAVLSTMLGLGSVSIMSTDAKASRFWVRSDGASIFFHCHRFRSCFLTPSLNRI